jgi:hypothetical protein
VFLTAINVLRVDKSRLNADSIKSVYISVSNPGEPIDPAMHDSHKSADGRASPRRADE